MNLSNDEVLRYSRHLIMPEVGVEGQEKLKTASVLCIGTGGLGSPVALYLAAAGVGRLGLVDFDVVDFSNLQRQIIHTTADVGRSKLESAREKIRAINPNVQVDLHEVRLDSSNALDILKDYDVIVDGTDNFPTRYLVNDACVLLGKPNVYGSIFRFEGQASVFDATRGPCYRCLYAEPPPPALMVSGPLGVVPGVIGLIQATETIKLILGKGELLIGRLVLFDALAMRFRELKLQKDKSCPICGENPTIRELIDYEEFCGLRPSTGSGRGELVEPRGVEQAAAAHAEYDISAEELAQLLKDNRVVLVDVRELPEYEICYIEGSILLPLSEFSSRVNELNSADEIVLCCYDGVRSMEALEILRKCGFQKIKSLAGGIAAWAERIDPTMPRY